MAYVCQGSALHDWITETNDDEIITYCGQCGLLDLSDYTPADDIYDTTYEMDRDSQWDA